MFEKLFPRDAVFFDALDGQTGRAVEAAAALVGAVNRGVVERAALERMGEIARASNEATLGILERLESRGGARAVHGEAHRLATRVDGIVGRLHTLLKRLHIYRLAPSDKDLAGFASVIEESVRELADASKRLRDPKERDAVARSCVSIARIAKIGGEMHDEALANLFDTERDPIAIVKWKEIYEDAGALVASCGDAAKVVSSIAGARRTLSP